LVKIRPHHFEHAAAFDEERGLRVLAELVRVDLERRAERLSVSIHEVTEHRSGLAGFG
jgi:hypothetical protein